MGQRRQEEIRANMMAEMQDDGEGGGGPNLADLCRNYSARDEDYKKCCGADCCMDREQLYNNRVCF